MKITIHYKKTVEENAGIYFDRAKKAKKKLEGVHKALKITEEKLKKIEEEQQKVHAQAKQEQKIAKAREKKEWYEKFRWFFTSNNHLVIGGRDAATNEMVIKKHTEKDNIVFHTDMAGSPFFVIQADKDEVTEEEKTEVAQAVAAYSKAWQKGMSSTDVFYVYAEQVTKKAQSGEYLATGSFMIRGKTQYVRFDEMAVAIGIKNMKIIGGPVVAIKKHAEKYLRILQGDQKPGAIAKEIKKRLGGGHPDDIIRFLPSGGTRIGK